MNHSLELYPSLFYVLKTILVILCKEEIEESSLILPLQKSASTRELSSQEESWLTSQYLFLFPLLHFPITIQYAQQQFQTAQDYRRTQNAQLSISYTILQY